MQHGRVTDLIDLVLIEPESTGAGLCQVRKTLPFLAERLADLLLDLVDGLPRRKEDAEFVPAQPRGSSAGRAGGPELARQAPQERIACGVAVCVVVLREAVEVSITSPRSMGASASTRIPSACLSSANPFGPKVSPRLSVCLSIAVIACTARRWPEV
jgi:hypothetical protein